MSFIQQIGNPNATYPPSLTLAQSANGVGLVSIGSDVKYVTFNPIPSFSWIPLSTNPYETYLFDWYTGTDFDGDYYYGYTPDFATFNALNVRSLGLYYDEPRLSGIINLDQYPNLDTLDLEYYDGNDISFLFNLPQNLYYLYLEDMPNVPNEQFTTLFTTLSNYTQMGNFGVGYMPQINNIAMNGLPELRYLSIDNTPISSLNIQNIPQLQSLTISDTQLTAINLQNYAQLQAVGLYNNPLKILTLQDLPIFNNITLFYNQIEYLTLVNLPSLTIINIQLQGIIRRCIITNLSAINGIEIRGSELDFISCNNTPQLQNLGLSENNLSAIDLSNLPQLASLNFSSNRFVTIDLSNLTRLQVSQLNFSSNQLTYVNMTGLSALYVDFSLNSLPLSAVNHIAVQCDLGNRANGTLYLNGGTNSPLSSVGVTAKNNLIAKGWTVLSNT